MDRTSLLGAAMLASTLITPAAHAADSVKASTASEVLQDDPAKHFAFHREGVNEVTARTDIIYCVDQAKVVLSLRDKMPSNGGLLGALINGRMAEIDRFRMRNAVMRKCMGLLGYDRYAMHVTDWKQFVNDGDLVLSNKGEVDQTVIDREAQFASGPTPKLERLPR